MFTEFETRRTPVREKLDSWREAVSEKLVFVNCSAGGSSDFDGAFSVVSAGECGLASLAGVSPPGNSR